MDNEVALRVVEDEPKYTLVGVTTKPVARLPPIPTHTISPETSRKILRGMLEDGRVASSGTPPAVVLVFVGVLAAVFGVVALLVHLIK
jgi:hypothetical protein